MEVPRGCLIPRIPSDLAGARMTQSCSVSLDVVDDDGFHCATAEPWDVRVIPDRPPTVSIRTSEVHLVATRDATVPLGIDINDDLAITIADFVANKRLSKTLDLCRKLSI